MLRLFFSFILFCLFCHGEWAAVFLKKTIVASGWEMLAHFREDVAVALEKATSFGFPSKMLEGEGLHLERFERIFVRMWL